MKNIFCLLLVTLVMMAVIAKAQVPDSCLNFSG
jgi:hypothetical protein